MPLSEEQRKNIDSIRAHVAHSSRADACTEDIRLLLSIIDTLQEDVEAANEALYAEVRELARCVRDEIAESHGDAAIPDELRTLCLYGASGTYTIPGNPT